MPTKIEKRRNFLVNILFLAAIFALVYVFFKYLFSITAPFILTFLFSILLQRPIRALDKKTNNKFHTLWSILLVVLVILVILIPLIFILSALFSRVNDLIKSAVAQTNDIPTFLATLEKEILDIGKFLPDSVYDNFSESVTDTFSKLIDDFDLSAIGINLTSITNGLTSGVSGIVNIAKNIPSVLLSLIIGIIAWILFTKDYNKVVRFIQLQLPENRKNVLFEVKQVFNKTVLKMIKAYALIMAITFGELFIGFTILSLAGIMHNSNYVWIAAGITIFDILPVAGSGGVLIPWAIYSVVVGNYQQAIGLIVIYVIITIIRQYIEPKIVGNSLGIHPLITLMGMYLGLKLFGFVGMLAVPFTVMTLKAFNDTGRIQLWKTPNRN